MLPPSSLTAVTVAPATGSFAEFVTSPTIAPDDTLSTVGEESSAWAAGTASPAIITHTANVLTQIEIFVDFIDPVPIESRYACLSGL